MMRGVFLVCALSLITFGCGSDEGSPPVISNIVYSPTSALIGFANGTLTMVGTVDFVDPDRDLAYIRVSKQECGQGPWKNLDTILSGVADATFGTQLFIALVSTRCPEGTYVVKVSVFDGQGHQSNELDAPITLTPAPPQVR